jgi:ribosomal protein L11 methyltransferase
VLLELSPGGFEEVDHGGELELAAYGPAAKRLLEAFPEAHASEIEAGWEDRWRDFHRPVRIGPLWVGPPWERAPEDAVPVVVDPGRAFGTGAHPTTRLCLEWLAELPRGGVLDVGCGSGVLAIAAARLDYEPVIAVDVAEAAVESTRANAVANGVALDVRLLDALRAPLPAADLVVANIALDTVRALAGRVDPERLLASGYLVADRPTLPDFVAVERRELDGWAADLFARD